jgi:hypothetical protein
MLRAYRSIDGERVQWLRRQIGSDKEGYRKKFPFPAYSGRATRQKAVCARDGPVRRHRSPHLKTTIAQRSSQPGNHLAKL